MVQGFLRLLHFYDLQICIKNLTPALSKGEGDWKIEAKWPPLTPPKEGDYLSEERSEEEFLR
jgi:hypothetical protein